MAEELGDQGIIAVTIHPATLMATNLVLEIGARPMSTIAEKAEAVMNLITASGIENGQYYDGHRPSRADPQADDDAARTRLRRLSQELTGVVDWLLRT